MSITRVVPAPVPHHHVVIVGAGMAGVGLLHRLREAGFTDVVALERADDIGGTWRDNTYPGCACDVPSALYSYSFAPNPDWSRAYSERAEILRYVQRTARDLGVLPQVRTGCELTAAAWQEDDARWSLETTRGPLTADVLVSAIGPFGEPSIPDFPGLDRFQGRAVHTFGWDTADADVRGRRVAVIGTGASAVQVVPAIRADAQHVSVFQRTPCWIMPRLNPRNGRIGRALRRLAPVRAMERAFQYAVYESYGTFNFVDARFASAFEAVARLHLRRQVRDPELRARLTPTYRIGCKRAAVSSDYLTSFGAPDVDLVTDRISEITERGIRTADGREHEVDTIVFATGFSMIHDTWGRIAGRDGRPLSDGWSQRPETYLGVGRAGFPNLFLTSGPFGGAGNQSFLYMLEAQFAYIVDALRTMRERDVAVVEVDPDAQETFVREAERRSERTIWLTGGCMGYYTTPDGTRNAGLWPDWSFRYRRRTARFDPTHHRLRPAPSPAAIPEEAVR